MEADILSELLKVTKMCSESTTRIEQKLTFIEKRVETLEDFTQKITDMMAEQKALSGAVAALSEQVNVNKNNIEANTRRIGELESAPAKNAYENWKRIVWICVPVFLTSICGWVVYIVKQLLKIVD